MAFLSLPPEILQYIAVCVETVHPSSLRAFSLTSKACHKASVFVVFRRISITVHDREGLRRDVNRLIETLSRTNSFRHVQQITINGDLRRNVKKAEGFGPQPHWIITTGIQEILREEPVDYAGLYAVYDESVIEKSSEEDMAWAPMSNLLQATTQLKDLIYDCQSQFPPSMLKTLHEQRPQCRLHHLTFKFRTLLWGVPRPYEMELATSPSLYRVKVACAERDSDGDDDFNLEAMMELTNGLAPNLKEVTVLNLLPGLSQRSVRPRESWSGLPGFTGENIGSLTSLSLKGYSRLRTPAVLQNWARHTDFACLQQLTLGGGFEAKTSGLSGETMEWAARTQSFPRVRTLSVYLTRDDPFEERPHYSEHAAYFFQSFDSLEQLSIDGPLDSRIVDTVLSHHGQTLKKLSLHPFEEKFYQSHGRDLRGIPFEFTKDRILQVKAQCPVLEELAIPIKRNRSSATEAELYKCLGGMESLRSLFLILDCSNWRVVRDRTYEPKFDEEDQKPLNTSIYSFLLRGELKETFINCAVDETLACSIWRTVTLNKTGKRLERLKLWPTGGGEYGGNYGLPPTFTGMAQNLTRSWLFERVPQDGKEEFTVRELVQDRREACDQAEADYLSYRHDPEIWEVFHSIWPSREGSKDWQDDWSSFPLQEPS